MTLTILIAEDVDLVADAFEALLDTQPDFTVVARVSRGDDVVPTAARHLPDVVLMDVDMPGASGIEATAALRSAGFKGRILLLTALPGSGHLQGALSAGADGYLLKSTTGARLISAIKTVAEGRTAIDPELAADAIRTGPSPLTTREAEILRFLRDGRSTEQIAGELFLSRGTVRNYLSSAMGKLGTPNRIEAIREASQRGWL